MVRWSLSSRVHLCNENPIEGCILLEFLGEIFDLGHSLFLVETPCYTTVGINI